MQFITNLKISARIYSGFAVLLLIIGTLAFLSYANGNSFENSLGNYARVSGNSLSVSTIHTKIIDMRRNVYLYAAEQKPKNANNVATINQAIQDELQTLTANTNSEERKATYQGISDATNLYAQNFLRVREALTHKSALVNEQLNVLGPEIRKRLTTIMQTSFADGDQEASSFAGRAQEGLMLTRLAAVRFLGSPSQQLADTVHSRMDVFATRVEDLASRLENPTRKRLANEVLAESQQYKAAFNQVATAAFLANKLIKEDMAASSVKSMQLANTIIAQQGNRLSEVMTETDTSIADSQLTSLTVSLVALAFGLLTAYVISGGIVNPVRKMTGAMGKLADGDLTTDIPAKDQRNEIGDMAAAVQIFKDNAIRVKRLEAEQEEQKQRAEAERRAAMHQLADTFERSVGQIIESVSSAATELQASSEQMASIAEETSAQSTTVAAASEEASANVQMVASSAEQLSASITEIGQQVQKSTDVSMRAVNAADDTSDSIQELSHSVGQIGEIVSLINDIADQTNLLALNATIEAARAGDAGKGFAVVAGEVKNLASQTSKATDEISSQIGQVQDGTNKAVDAIGSISTVISEMRDITTTIASAVEEQGAATSEIARNVEQASMGTAQVAANITTVEQAANDTGAAASQIRASATELSQQAETLRGEVGNFLHQVRADKEEMKLMQFDHSVLTGVAEIDDDHRELVELLNSSYRDMQTGAGTEAVIRIVNNLGTMIEDHFYHEETAMRQANYPNLHAHQMAHQELLAEFQQLKHLLESGANDAGPKLFHFLASWLQTHTYAEDTEFAQFLKDNNKLALLRTA